MTRMMRLKQWLWGLLSDNCEIEGCCRRGMRGNENVIQLPIFEGAWTKMPVICCDYCSSRQYDGAILRKRT